VRTFFRQGGVFRFRRPYSVLFGAKNIGFFEIYGVFIRTRRDARADIFWTREDVNFSRFCATSFMDGT